MCDTWDFDIKASYRFQQNFNQEKIAAMIFSNNVISASNWNDDIRFEKNNSDIYAAGLGFDKNVTSKDTIKTRIRNHYLDLTFEIGVPNSNFYLQMGLPFQGNYINNKVLEKNNNSQSTGSQVKAPSSGNDQHPDAVK